MPFKKGPAAWRRSIDYLKSGSLIFKEKVKVCSVNFHETEPESVVLHDDGDGGDDERCRLTIIRTRTMQCA